MSELWETLTTGLILSLIFIAVSYFFWRRYDKPTPLMIERREEKLRLKEEQRTWREVEARLRAENEEAELKAVYERRKAEERARAHVPATEQVKDAWKSLGVTPLETTPTFEAEGADANEALRASEQADLTEPSVDDGDVLDVEELVQVRQDTGVQPTAEEPDWNLIEKLSEIAEKDEIVVPDVPSAPDLDTVAAETTLSQSAESGDEPIQETNDAGDADETDETNDAEEVVWAAGEKDPWQGAAWEEE